MKIAINAVSLAPGGGLVVLLGLLKVWQTTRAPWEITVYASRQEVLSSVKAACPHVKIEPFAVGMPAARHFVMQQFRLGPLIERLQYPVVLSTNMMVGRCSIPQIVHHQNLKRFQVRQLGRQLVLGGIAETLKDWAAHRAVKKAKVNTYISRYLMEQANQCLSSDRPQFVVANGIDDRWLDEAVRRPQESRDSATILAVQNDSPHKDGPALVRTLQWLVQNRAEVDWRLKIVGDGRWIELKQLAKSLGVDARIEWVGLLDHAKLLDYYRHSSVLLFPSRIEGFGLPPLEAMAVDLPVVCANATALPEIVGDAGILVEAGNYEGFGQAIWSIHQDPQLRQRLNGLGRQQVKKFRWSESAERMARIIEATVDDRIEPLAEDWQKTLSEDGTT